MQYPRIIDPITGIRRIFYLVSPNETSFKSPSDVPNYITEASPYFGLLIVLELLICKLTGHRSLRNNDAVSSLSAGLFSRLPLVAVRGLELAAYQYVYKHYHVVELAWDSPWTWWATFLGVDFCYYWAHRGGHEFNFMWAAHQVHHSSEDYNLTTATRQSVLERYTTWMLYLPLALAVPPQAVMVHIQFNLLYQFWIHTELIRSLGPLEWILNTPSHHRVHHGRNPYCIDKNYAGTLIIWDRMFGTFVAEGEEVVYGHVHPLSTWDPIYTQFFYIKQIYKKMKKQQGILNKLSVLIKGPGWRPGQPRLGNPDSIPQIKYPAQKYNKGLPTFYSAYVLLHFYILLAGFQRMMTQRSSFGDGITLQTDVQSILFITFILYCLSCFGALSDRRWYAPYMELARCLFLVVMAPSLSTIITGRVPILLTYILQAIFTLSAALWTTTCLRLLTDPKLRQKWQ